MIGLTMEKNILKTVVIKNLIDFIDFEAYGKYIGDYNTEECENGIIEIR